jgi:hypothetical protein
MEPSQLSFIASLSSTIAYAGIKSYGICKSQYKSRVFGLLVSNTEGLSDVLEELTLHEKVQPLVVLDCLKDYLDEEKLEVLHRLQRTKSPYYHIYLNKHFNEYLKILKKSNKEKVFIIITDCLQLLKDLKVKKEQTSMLLPSTKYYIKLLDKVENKYQDQENREQLIHLHYPKFYFNNKQELVNIFSKLFTKGQDVSNYV